MQGAQHGASHKVNTQVIPLFNTYLTNEQNVPGSLLGVGAIETTHKNPFLHTAGNLLPGHYVIN